MFHSSITGFSFSISFLLSVTHTTPDAPGYISQVWPVSTGRLNRPISTSQKWKLRIYGSVVGVCLYSFAPLNYCLLMHTRMNKCPFVYK